MSRIPNFLKATACVLLISLAGCQSARTITFLQINDVYEIAPLDNGNAGGLARVAYVNNQLKKENPEGTFFVLAGDFLSPSVIGTLKYEGERIKGRQMVDVLNQAGLDYATFGNHEFDYDDDTPATLNQRIDESKFRWTAANVEQRVGNKMIPFKQAGTDVPTSVVLTSGKVRVGLFGICIPVNKDFVQITDPVDAARRAYDALAPRTDAVVALTHLTIADDRRIAARVPGLALVMGGHEHDNTLVHEGKVPIAKADANAKTVYIHRLRFDRRHRFVGLDSELKTIDETVPEDSATAAAVTRWQGIADASFRAQGFDPNEIIYTATIPWDGREKTTRREHRNLTTLIAQSMFDAFPGSDAAVFNGGSIRVDDMLEGPISQYDIVRIMPFGGGISQASITGDLLDKILEAGRLSRGKGAFLHHANIRYDDAAKIWSIGGQPLDKTQIYKVVLPDFLLTGKEFGMSFLNPANPGIVSPIITPAEPDSRTDVRKVFVNFLKKM